MSALTTDALLGGAVRLRQPKAGFRAGVDSLLLAAAVQAPPGARALEIGCGAGAALLAAAVFNPHATFLGVEKDPASAALAAENIVANGFSDRVALREVDPIADLALGLGPSFDVGFCNPPFNAKGRAPAPARAHAHLSQQSLDAWVKGFANRLKGGAALVIIHRADALQDLLDALRGRLGGVQVRPIHPFADKPAHRLLVRARKGARAAPQILPPLVLHEAGAKYTPQANAILRGEEHIAWF